LVARNGAGIDKVADLKGKTVGVPLGSTSHFSLMGALENAGIAASTVKVVGMSPDQIVAAWSQNEIDAAFIWDPAQSKLRQNGKIIIDAGQVTGKPTYDGWVVNTQFGKDHRDFVVAFVKAIAKADSSYISNPSAWTAESTSVKTIADRAGAKPGEVPEILKGYGFPSLAEQLSPAWFGGGTQKNIAATAKFLMEQKKISTVLDDYSKFVNPSFIADAMK
jgi:taurine transport system substrate-binding protein